MKLTVDVDDQFIDEIAEAFPKLAKESGGKEELAEAIVNDVIYRYCNWEYVNEYTLGVD